MDFYKLCSYVESLLFIKSSPMSIAELNQYFRNANINLLDEDLEKIISYLQNKYIDKSSGLEILNIDGKFQIITKKSNYKILSLMISPVKKKTLTQSSLETLTIIAYNQPVTKSFVEKIKGIKSDTTINTLLDTGLIEISGQLKKLGNPNLYITTDKFLKYLNINTLEELPNYYEFKNKSFE